MFVSGDFGDLWLGLSLRLLVEFVGLILDVISWVLGLIWCKHAFVIWVVVLCWFVIVLFRAGFEFGCWVLIMVGFVGVVSFSWGRALQGGWCSSIVC